MKKSKRVLENLKKVERTREYPLEEAVNILSSLSPAKFDETVEAHINLGVDPRHADQMVRGTVSLPHGTGKEVRVLVLTKSKLDEAEKAGADYYGLDEFVEKIQSGWLDVDAVIATPDAMPAVGKLGKILGPKKMMPNPKSGTVTNDVENTVKELKAGRLEIRVDRYGIVHTVIGKLSFPREKLIENIKSLVSAIIRLKPAAAKGQYLKKFTLSTSMGPGIRVDRASLTD